MAGPSLFDRMRRLVVVAAFGCVLIVGGCMTIGAAVTGSGGGTGGGGPSTGYRGAPVAGPPVAPPAPNLPTWTGGLRVTKQGIDMGQQPPVTDTLGGIATVVYNPDRGELGTTNSGPAALWTSPVDPTYEDCVSVLATQPLADTESQAIPYRQDQGLCVETFNGAAIAFVRGVTEEGGRQQAVQMSGIRWVDTSR